MFLIPFVSEPIGGNGAKVYCCSSCGGLITHSDQLLSVDGRSRHCFVNPSGIEFDFRSFSFCAGAIALGEATEEHTWFAGYRWRIALCRTCGLHMGWHYEALLRSERPREFWGILTATYRRPCGRRESVPARRLRHGGSEKCLSDTMEKYFVSI